MPNNEIEEAMQQDAATLVKALAELFSGKTKFVVTKVSADYDSEGNGRIETTYEVK